jgi:hypothetical protein
MPTHGLRLQAYQLLGLAVKAQDEGRPADAHDLTAKVMEHLEDAISVEEIRRASASISEHTPSEIAGPNIKNFMSAMRTRWHGKVVAR